MAHISLGSSTSAAHIEAGLLSGLLYATVRRTTIQVEKEVGFWDLRNWLWGHRADHYADRRNVLAFDVGPFFLAVTSR